MPSQPTDVVYCSSLPTSDEFRLDILTGLRSSPKTLPCKYFYDEQGCELFEQICELDEYYLTRTELSIMRQHAYGMAALIEPDSVLIELGSGSSKKTRLLLDHMREPLTFMPIDIAEDALVATAADLREQYPEFNIAPLCADFARTIDLPIEDTDGRFRAAYFPGSTIGNFEPVAAKRLLGRIADMIEPHGGLLIGLDLQKPKAIIEAAYNDSQGVTDAFNLNLLARINRELDADFDLDAFKHVAFYNDQHDRVEIYLESLREQSILVGGQRFTFEANERICTEYSHKYDAAQFARLARQLGLELQATWTDDEHYFAVQFYTI